MQRPIVFLALALLAAGQAHAAPRRATPLKPFQEDGCRAGSYSVVHSPDGSALSILFDNFSVDNSTGATGLLVRRACNLVIPLNLPAGYSLGVYRVDYRGFAKLPFGQTMQLNVNYGLGQNNKDRQYHREIRGPHEADYLMSENIGAGLMKRVGCGTEAVLNVSVGLQIQSARMTGGGLASLDSADGAAKGGLIYQFDLKKCRP